MTMQELREAILSAYLYVDKATQATEGHGDAAYKAGNTKRQHALERTAHALMQAQTLLTDAMIALEDSK